MAVAFSRSSSSIIIYFLALNILSTQSVTKKTRCWGESPVHFTKEVVTQVWFHRLRPREVLQFITDVSHSCAGPCATLSPAGTRGDKLLSLHLGWSSTYSTIRAAISANGCVTLFQIDQLQCVGHSLSHLFNQLWAITLSSQDLFCGPPQWLGAIDESPGWSDEAVSWERHTGDPPQSKSYLKGWCWKLQSHVGLCNNSTLAFMD